MRRLLFRLAFHRPPKLLLSLLTSFPARKQSLPLWWIHLTDPGWSFHNRSQWCPSKPPQYIQEEIYTSKSSVSDPAPSIFLLHLKGFHPHLLPTNHLSLSAVLLNILCSFTPLCLKYYSSPTPASRWASPSLGHPYAPGQDCVPLHHLTAFCSLCYDPPVSCTEEQSPAPLIHLCVAYCPVFQCSMSWNWKMNINCSEPEKLQGKT